MRKEETRPVEVIYCDFCNKETAHVTKCVICGREGCNQGGNKAHFAYSGSDVYRYKDIKRGHFSVCNECAASKPAVNLTYGDILNKLIDG